MTQSAPPESLLTPEILAFIGRETGRSEPVEVEKGAIRHFVEAVEDRNPIFVDEAYAKGTRYGGLVAPPSWHTSFGYAYDRVEDGMPPAQEGGQRVEDVIPLKRLVHAGTEHEFYEPIRPGDVLTTVSKIVDIFQRQGSVGPMIFVVTETTTYNQEGRAVRMSRSSLIHR